MVARDMKFALGGLLVLLSLIPIEIAILGSVPMLNLVLLTNFGTLGLILGFIGFLLIGNALFGE